MVVASAAYISGQRIFDSYYNKKMCIRDRDLFVIAEQVGCVWKLEKLCRNKALKAAANKPEHAKLFLKDVYKRQTASTAERGGWYMSAATMTAATVSRWMMGRDVSAS